MGSLRIIFQTLFLTSAVVGAFEALAQHGPSLPPAEFEEGKRIYFEKCSGCHGSLRNGATGPALTPQTLRGKPGRETMQTMMNGSSKGMPAWGNLGILTHEQLRIMNRYIRMEPPTPPGWGESEIGGSWKLLVPVSERPTQKESTFDTDNVFAVTLRDAGAVALISGETKEIVSVIPTGFAVHISRYSASGRYLYTVGRDGRVTMVDLWMREPQAVAEVRIGLEARSVEVSRHLGFEDRYVVAGSYWPSQYVILDGETLKPVHHAMTDSFAEPSPSDVSEVRVAGIVASHIHPEFLLNLKEAGKVLVVDYSTPSFAATEIPAIAPLHDGGFDASHRYFLAAANSANKVAVIDTQERRLAALVETHISPHPGRGANFVDPDFGPVWATTHLGDAAVDLIGTDPENHPQHAWKVVRSLSLSGSGSLFIKTHPNSKNIWVDAPLSVSGDDSRFISVFDIEDLTKAAVRIDLAAAAGISGGQPRIVQPEYDRHGREVWVSVWNTQDQTSALVVIDDSTRTVKYVIKDKRLITPTGKFNSFNTRHSVY